MFRSSQKGRRIACYYDQGKQLADAWQEPHRDSRRIALDHRLEDGTGIPSLDTSA